MRKKCKLLSFVLLGTLLFAFNFGIVNAAPKSVTVKRAEVLSDLITNHDHGFTIFTTSEGKILYCLDNLKPALLSGQVASDNGKADDGVLYILRNGYPNKKITGNIEMDKYITQAAVWWYMDDTNQGSNKLSDEFRNATTTDINNLIPMIKTLVANAKNYKDNQAKPTVSVSLDNQTLALTSDNKYYESQPINVKVTGASNYSAIFNGGTPNTAIVNVNGTPATTFKAGESFKVRIPASELKEKTDINIKVTANGIEQVAKVYKTSDDKYQRVVGLYDENIPVTQSLKLVASPETTSIEVDVPNTSANILMLSVAIGMLIIVAGIGIIVYRSKKIHQN
ncbi:MAG: Cys-Gln thioester bond-forming surface protein [Bacilli bacterium]|nr:Cys-Gln thioester bond-forming surface protein [Bacilli bacterium]